MFWFWINLLCTKYSNVQHGCCLRFLELLLYYIYVLRVSYVLPVVRCHVPPLLWFNTRCCAVTLRISYVPDMYLLERA